MFSNFEIIVGIEVHVVLNTKTKMFSPSKSNHNDSPNVNISPIDLGHPGIMPSPNAEAIKKGIVLAKAFNMKIQNNIVFDRKNYFYQDLPKGFQITQQFFPIGYDGKIVLENGSEIFLERIHLEEDTAKQFKKEDGIYLDYNRAGMPLIEIVTKPCIRSPKDVSLFLKELKRILTFNKISDAKLEEGSMRADVNISVRPYGSNFFGTRVEIKNINSVSNVEKAIEFETKEQIKQVLSLQNVKQVTKRFNDKTEETEYLRAKTNAIDYRYLT
ncbi:MAG: Asp-tRNA(Asn)/Glu-tRNA(Gln) amidotransferase subunit GatB, partial [Malacoplasma sp.]|nr:Asp-tRNA(Asn)/Glu-tRNA(Gln) amidotransferase subunit GatB [Malacoplasma sp.]